LRSLASFHSFEHHLMRRPQLQERLDRMLAARAYDVIQVEFSQMAPYRFEAANGARPKLVLDEHNIEYEIIRRTAESESSIDRKVYSTVNWRKLKREEHGAWRRFDGVALTSARDQALLHRDAPETRTAVVPNAVDLDSFCPSTETEEPETLLFFGAM